MQFGVAPMFWKVASLIWRYGSHDVVPKFEPQNVGFCQMVKRDRIFNTKSFLPFPAFFSLQTECVFVLSCNCCLCSRLNADSLWLALDWCYCHSKSFSIILIGLWFLLISSSQFFFSLFLCFALTVFDTMTKGKLLGSSLNSEEIQFRQHSR